MIAFCVGLSALFFAGASRIPQLEPIVTSIHILEAQLDCRLVDCDGILDRRIRGPASGWAIFPGLLANLGWRLPTALNETFDPAAGTYVDLLPILVMVLVTALVLMNAKAVFTLQFLLVLLKFSALTLFILVGIFH